MIRHPRTVLSALLLVVLLGLPDAVGAQPTPEPQPASQPIQLPPSLAIEIEPTGESATLTYFNRPILVLRARVMGRRPSDRAATARSVLDDLVERRLTGPVELHPTTDGILVGIGERVVIAVTKPDVDEVRGETLEQAAQRTAERIHEALEAAVETQRPWVLLRAIAFCLGVLVAIVGLLWFLGRIKRVASRYWGAYNDRMTARLGLTDRQKARADYLLNFVQERTLGLVTLGAGLFGVYALVTFTLRQFPYTRPWGDSLRGFFTALAGNAFQGFVDAIPGLITIVVILAVVRFVTLLLEPWFDALERGAITAPYIYPETAVTTRRLVTLGLWLFAAALAYPYVPGSNTEAFKGISVFVGLMVTLGSSGFVNQVMSGIMVTYSRALRVGDYVRIGEAEGTIVHLGLLSTKLKTIRSEEITIPNAVVVSQTTTDYSRFPAAVVTLTTVSIGYEVPWRQVHAMLLLAAERTPGVRQNPKPRVIQAGLEDHGVRYGIGICLEQQQTRIATLSALHANIQDLFNEYGVQIMTPSYEGDPETPKVVPKDSWYSSPARPDSTS